MPERPATIHRILLITGLLEPRFAMWPLRHRLRQQWGDVDVWRDRHIFRDVDSSVARLSDWIRDDGSSTQLAIVTHSFGDWIARRAIAQTPGHRVTALASIAPVMHSGCMIQAIHYLGGDFIPEIAIIADPKRARDHLDCDPSVRRLVIWAKVDLGVRAIDLTDLPQATVERVAATHLSVIMQPNVHGRIERFLQGKSLSKGSTSRESPPLVSLPRTQ